MRSKLPSDAFAYYVSLGPDRSYHAVAKYFSVDKTTVVRRATVERWQQQLDDIEKKAQANTKEKLVDSLTEMNDRHLKILRVVLGKALEALRGAPIRSTADAVRAIDICVKHERVILGEPSERSDVSMESIVRGEYERWMVREEAEASATNRVAGKIGASTAAERGASRETPAAMVAPAVRGDAIGEDGEDDDDR